MIRALDVGKGFAVLRDPAVRKIAIANPLHAPYGRAAEEALRKAGVYDAVKDRLVLGENISQAAQFAESGNADAGIIALSLAARAGLKEKGRYWTRSRKFVRAASSRASWSFALRRIRRARRHFSITSRLPRRPRCWSDTDLLLPGKEKALNWQAIALSLKLAVSRRGDSAGRGPSHRVLGDVLALALEISGRGDCRAPAGFASHGAGLLHSRGAWAAKSSREDSGSPGSATRCRSRSAACWSRPCCTACRSRCSHFRPDLKPWTAG